MQLHVKEETEGKDTANGCSQGGNPKVLTKTLFYLEKYTKWRGIKQITLTVPSSEPVTTSWVPLREAQHELTKEVWSSSFLTL